MGLESEWLNRSIDEIFREDGTFSSHQEKEYNRLFDRFGKYYGEWMAGEAMKGGAFYSKPMFPNGPNMLQTAVMVAGITGGPLNAFILSTLTTGLQVADGSMGWKQATFQVGVSAATALIGAGAEELGAFADGVVGTAADTAIEAGTEVAEKSLTQVVVENFSKALAQTLLSGVKLEGGGLGYDKKRMTSGKTWLAAGVTAGAGSIAGGYNLTGLSSAAVNGLGSTLSSGITTGDWSESFRTGAINTAGNYLGGLVSGGISEGLGTENEYTKALISNYATYGMRRLLGSGEDFNMGTIGTVDTVNMVMNSLYQDYKKEEKINDLMEKGGLTVEQAAEVLKKMELMKTQREKEKQKEDPLAAVDEALSGIFVSMGRGLGQNMKEIGDSIESGAKWAYDGIGTIAGIAAKGIGEFGQSVKNKIIWGEFGTNSNAAVENAKLNYQFKEVGLTAQNSEMNYQPGAIIESEDGQIFQINLDEEGNRILVDTGINKNDAYLQMAGTDSDKDHMSQLTLEGKDCLASIKWEFLPVKLSG